MLGAVVRERWGEGWREGARRFDLTRLDLPARALGPGLRD